MPRHVSRAAAIAEVAAAVNDAGGGTVLVGVDGPGGAGKSTFAAELARGVPAALVVPVDDFAGPHVPEWDWQRLREQVLEPVLAGRPGRYQRFVWNRDLGLEWHDVPSGHLLIIEGVSSTRRELGLNWLRQIWVDAPREVRLRRAFDRDGAAMLAHWLEVWMPSEDAYVARERPRDRVDLIVSGTEE